MSCNSIEDIPTFKDLVDTLQQTETNIKKLRYYLIKQLNNCGIVGTDNCTFKELIEKVGEIDAPEHYNSNNIKPTNEPSIDATDIFEYLGNLYKRIRYYMRLLAYYLALKKVPTNIIAEETTLKGLISLISLIEVRTPSILTIQPITTNYYFGENIFLDYTLVDNKNNPINEGEITIESNGLLYDSIIAGDPITFTPIAISEVVNGQPQPIIFTITYHGSDKYKKNGPISRDIIVLPAKIKLDLFITNINAQSNYYSSSTTGYTDDEWSIMIKTYNYKDEPLPNIPFRVSIGSTTISDVTDDNSICIINQVINQVGNQTINVTTTYENTQLMTNTSKEHEVTIYYNPLYQAKNTYVDYRGKNNYQYELIIRNKNTGAQYDSTLNGQQINLYLDDNPLPSITINQGKAIATINNLDIGEHTLRWDLQGNQRKTIITIYSNFILPNKTKFFLPETPDIYYTPLYTETYGTTDWSPIINKKAIANISYYDEDDELQLVNDGNSIEIYTNSNGILHAIKNYNNLYTYTIALQSGSDSLNESVTYEYEINKPFDIVLNEETYDKKIKAEYDIYVYDTEHYNLGDYNTCISFNNNIKQYCTITDERGVTTNSEDDEEPESVELISEYYHIHVIIPCRNETHGIHTLTMALNGYSEEATFTLSEQIFELLTNSTTIGTNQIQIKCYDNSVEDISIESEHILVNEITKNNNIFTIDADFIKAGNITFNVQSEEDEESFTLTVNKGDINANILIEKIAYDETHTIVDEHGHETQSTPIYEVDECFASELDNIQVSLVFDDIFYGDINVVYSVSKNNTDYYTEYYTFNADSEEKYFTIPSNLTADTYTIKFTYNANVNSIYNSFVKTKTLSVINNLIPLAVYDVDMINGDLYIESYTDLGINNTELVIGLSITNDELTIEKQTFINATDTDNIVTTITLDDNADITYNQIKDNGD